MRSRTVEIDVAPATDAAPIGALVAVAGPPTSCSVNSGPPASVLSTPSVVSSSQASPEPDPVTGPSGTASPRPTGTASVPRRIPAIHTSDRPPVTSSAASRAPSRETAIARTSEAPGQASATANCWPAIENAVTAEG